jgi:hypothetical protein
MPGKETRRSSVEETLPRGPEGTFFQGQDPDGVVAVDAETARETARAACGGG